MAILGVRRGKIDFSELGPIGLMMAWDTLLLVRGEGAVHIAASF